MFFLLAAACTAPPPPSSDVIAPFDDGSRPGDTGEPEDTGIDDPPDTGTRADPIDDAPRILLNEAMSANKCAASVSGSTPDYFELYNASPTRVALADIAVRDNSGALWVGPAGVDLSPGEVYAVYADGAPGADHAAFALSSDGDTLTVITRGQVTDRLGLGWLPDNTAWARIPDGEDWTLNGVASPGELNGDTTGAFADPFASAFDLDHVREVSVVLDSDAVQALRTNPTAYTPGGIDLEGVYIDPVGVRLRGSSTFQSIDQKPSMKIDFNRYDGLGDCASQKKINLLNMVYDTGFVKQWSAFHIMRAAGVASPRNGFVAVTAADIYRGVYLYSEASDDQFLEQMFGYPSDTEGWMIWEGSTECERGPCDETILAAMNSLLAGTASEAAYEQLGAIMDWEEVLEEIAGEAIVQQTDGFCAPHNYRWYYDPVIGKLGLIPSSVDLTFYSPVSSVNPYRCSGQRHLAWCLEVDTCAELYDQIVLDYADAIEAELELDAQFDTISAMLEPYWERETYVYASASANRAGLETIRTYFQQIPERLRSVVDAH